MTIAEIEKKLKTLNQSHSTALAKKDILENNKTKYANEFNTLKDECKTKFKCEPKELADKINKLGLQLESKLTEAENKLNEIMGEESK